MYDIVTIGDAVKDTFITPHNVDAVKKNYRETEICFPHGSKITIDETHHDIGGSACNVAVGLSRLGLKATFIGSVGSDNEGNEVMDRLNQENIDTKFVKISKKNCTNFSVILVYKGQRTVFVYRSNNDYSEIKIPGNLNTRWLYLGPVASSFSSNYKKLIALACERNINLAINPGHRQIIEARNELKKLLYATKVLILNMEEAKDLVKTGSFLPKDLLKKLKSYGPEVVVITDGMNGAYATDGENYYHVKTYANDALDPTGAGDGFSTGFLSIYMKNNDIIESLKAGNMVSNEVIKVYGAEVNLPDANKLSEDISKSPSPTEI